MELRITHSNLDLTVGLNAVNAYKSGNYKAAVNLFQQILDYEPRNWLARLYLAVCYYKTGQMAASQRAFRYVNENCPDKDLCLKATQSLEAIGSQLNSGNARLPMEFGRYSNSPGAI